MHVEQILSKSVHAHIYTDTYVYTLQHTRSIRYIQKHARSLTHTRRSTNKTPTLPPPPSSHLILSHLISSTHTQPDGGRTRKESKKCERRRRRRRKQQASQQQNQKHHTHIKKKKEKKKRTEKTKRKGHTRFVAIESSTTVHASTHDPPTPTYLGLHLPHQKQAQVRITKTTPTFIKQPATPPSVRTVRDNKQLPVRHTRCCRG